jgi:hypothetical protein
MTPSEPPTPSSNRNAVFLAGLIGMAASIGVGIAEFSLHFTPTLDYGGAPYVFFVQTPSWRLTLGHFLAIYALPMYFVGYWHLSERLKPAAFPWRAMVMGLGIFSFTLGGVWIGSRVYPAILIQAETSATSEETKQTLAKLLDTAAFYNENVLTGTRLGILVVSVLFVWLVSTGRTSYPRWMALLNPILLVLLCFLLYFLLPSIGGYVMPIAMNAAHFVLFTTSTLLMLREAGT